ncbi:tyrosine-type recombinase/integrase [Roseobacteraceae bacterium NS-SX3]
MTTLSQHLDNYLFYRRSFGYELDFSERVLRKFAEFADDRGQHHLTTDLFLAWKEAYGKADKNTWAARFGMVRGFAGWLAEGDPHTEIPPAGLIVGRYVRSQPYIFSQAEVASLIDAAGCLPSAYGLRALVWQTLFGLIAVTGLRVNEALRIETMDIDFENNVLCIRTGKSGGARAIPLLSCTMRRLRIYAAERDRLLGRGDRPFFRKEDGSPAGDCGARYNFAEASRIVGLRSPTRYHRHGSGPRIHDLRHTFAVHTILDWFRQGRDIDREMYRLSTYLGHTKPEHTYWYIEAVPELLELALARSEARFMESAS